MPTRRLFSRRRFTLVLITGCLLGTAASVRGGGVVPDWAAFGKQAVVASADVNGDGLMDLIAGAPVELDPFFPLIDQGAAYLYLGRNGGPSTTPDLLFRGPALQAGAFLGYSVASAGDVNGDGYEDVLIGAPGYSNDQGREGRALLFFGSPSGPGATPDWYAESNQDQSRFGEDVRGAGDVNGDGYDDIVITAPQYSNGQTGEGIAWLYYGSPSGPGATPDWTFESDLTYGHLASGSTAGDVNGDGFDDLVLGATYFLDAGRAWLFLGSADGLAERPAWEASDGQFGSNFGALVGTAGDVNGDGFDDILITAPYYDDPEDAEGKVFLWMGGPTGSIGQGISGSASNADWSFEGNQVQALLSQAAGDFDFNGDGFSDVVVGAPHYDDGVNDEGRILMFHGSAAGLDPSPFLFSSSGSPSALLGSSVAAAGDDVVVSAPHYGAGADGAIFLYRGACEPCRPVDITITFGSDIGKGSATVRWRTEIERDLQGFNLVIIDNQGNRITQNPVLIPCEECITNLGHTYTYILPKHRSGRNIYIEQVHKDGRVDTFGPAIRQ